MATQNLGNKNFLTPKALGDTEYIRTFAFGSRTSWLDGAPQLPIFHGVTSWYWSAFDLVGEVADGGLVSSWTDRNKGVVCTQPLTSRQPTFREDADGAPAIELLGVADWLESTTTVDIGSGAGYAFFAPAQVYNPRDTYGGPMALNATGVSTQNHYEMYTASDTLHFVSGRGNANGYLYIPSSYGLSGDDMIWNQSMEFANDAINDAATCRVAPSRVVRYQGATYSTQTAQSIREIDRSDTTLHIGRGYSWAAYNGLIRAIIMYDRALTADETQEVWDYITLKYYSTQTAFPTPTYHTPTVYNWSVDDLSHLYDGERVDTWTDNISGQTMRSTGTFRPTYRANVGGFPAVEFDGAQHMWTDDDINITDNLYFGYVGKSTQEEVGGRITKTEHVASVVNATNGEQIWGWLLFGYDANTLYDQESRYWRGSKYNNEYIAGTGTRGGYRAYNPATLGQNTQMYGHQFAPSWGGITATTVPGHCWYHPRSTKYTGQVDVNDPFDDIGKLYIGNHPNGALGFPSTYNEQGFEGHLREICMAVDPGGVAGPLELDERGEVMKHWSRKYGFVT